MKQTKCIVLYCYSIVIFYCIWSSSTAQLPLNSSLIGSSMQENVAVNADSGGGGGGRLTARKSRGRLREKHYCSRPSILLTSNRCRHVSWPRELQLTQVSTNGTLDWQQQSNVECNKRIKRTKPRDTQTKLKKPRRHCSWTEGDGGGRGGEPQTHGIRHLHVN